MRNKINMSFFFSSSESTDDGLQRLNSGEGASHPSKPMPGSMQICMCVGVLCTSLRRDVVSFSEKLVYIGAGLGVVVLALAIVLLIFFRHRKRDISASSGIKQTD